MTGPFLTPLDAQALAARGVPDDWRFGMADRVRFAELDALKHVNHAAYLAWFEMLRVHYVRDIGLSSYDLQTGPEIVLKAIDCQYHAPMFLGEDYVVTARTVSFRRTSFRMAYAVFAPDLRVEGSALIVLLDRDSGQKTPIPEHVRTAFVTRDAARDER